MIDILAKQNEPGKGHETGLMLLSFAFNRRFPGKQFPSLTKGKYGKPSFIGQDFFEFNISHSGNWTVLAVSERSVGVDIQKKKEIRPLVVRRFYTNRENNYIASLPDSEKTDAVMRIWSIKEAVTKVRGDSLAERLSQIQTISFDNTFASSFEGVKIYSPDFIDPDYFLSAASESEEEISISYL